MSFLALLTITASAHAHTETPHSPTGKNANTGFEEVTDKQASPSNLASQAELLKEEAGLEPTKAEDALTLKPLTETTEEHHGVLHSFISNLVGKVRHAAHEIADKALSSFKEHKDFFVAVKEALADGKITQEEKATIAKEFREARESKDDLFDTLNRTFSFQENVLDAFQSWLDSPNPVAEDEEKVEEFLEEIKSTTEEVLRDELAKDRGADVA